MSRLFVESRDEIVLEVALVGPFFVLVLDVAIVLSLGTFHFARRVQSIT